MNNSEKEEDITHGYAISFRRDVDSWRVFFFMLFVGLMTLF